MQKLSKKYKEMIMSHVKVSTCIMSRNAWVESKDSAVGVPFSDLSAAIHDSEHAECRRRDFS